MMQQAKARRVKRLLKMNPECRKRYIGELEKIQKQKASMEIAVDSVDGGLLSEVLAQIYLCGRTLEETAAELNYSKRQIERLHIKALSLLML